MALMRTANPALPDDAFSKVGRVTSAEDAMTIQGTVNRTAFLLFLAAMTATWTWEKFMSAPASVMPWLMGGLIGGLILGFATSFKPSWSPVTAPLYAICEGALLGAISAMYEAQFGGIVIQAVGLTFGTLFCLLAAYKTGLVRATEGFKMGLFAATGALCLFYLITFILGFFGVHMHAIFGNGLIGIGFSAVVVTIAALNLVLDFDFIEQGAERGAPKHMEWYGAFALLVTLVWLYMEILRLLSKLRSRD